MATISPNMNLIVPVAGVDTGLVWEQSTAADLSIIDGHDHSTGKGVPITPAGLNISSDLSFNGNQATTLKAVAYQAQGSLSTLLSTYVVGADLYYNDGSGNAIQITKSGSVNATSSGISSGTASASFVAGVLVVNSAPLTPANIQAGSILLGNNVANSKFLTLSPPSAMAANYTVTLPALPAVNNSFVTMDTSGNLRAVTTIDGFTIINTSGVLSVNPLIKNIYTEHQFQANGVYSKATFPQTNVDGLMFFELNATIIAVWIFNLTAGSAGTTEFDLKVASPGGSFASILSTTGQITSAAASNIWTDSNLIVGAQTGVTKPVLSGANVSAGQALRFDLLQTMTGAANCGVIVQYVPR